MARDDSTLPGWIPYRARYIYSCTGPYTDPRREEATQTLFHAASLESLFRYLDGLWLSEDVWAYLLACIANAVECVPEGGAATRERPDFKVRTLVKQVKADGLLSQIGTKARELAGLLDSLDDLRAKVPDETYSTLSLLSTALSRNAASTDFERYRRSLSSYQEHGFPAPADVLQALAASADAHPPASEIFSDDPWLSSQQSTWRDFVRIVANDISMIYDIHQEKIELKEKHWLALVQALISSDISRSSVNAALRALPPFSWEPGKK